MLDAFGRVLKPSQWITYAATRGQIAVLGIGRVVEVHDESGSGPHLIVDVVTCTKNGTFDLYRVIRRKLHFPERVACLSHTEVPARYLEAMIDHGA